MKTRLLYIGIGLLAAFAASAQKKSPIDFTPATCVRGGELGLLQMSVAEKGELRAYFRRINTTDWCSVEGVNEGPLSRIVLPKFETGDDIEYFIVLIDGRRVIARSPRIFRAHVSEDCQTPFARHVLKIALSCGDDATGIPSSMGAGYSVQDHIVRGNPPVPSPDQPNQQQQQ
jgi:hypothetical protein